MAGAVGFTVEGVAGCVGSHRRLDAGLCAGIEKAAWTEEGVVVWLADTCQCLVRLVLRFCIHSVVQVEGLPLWFPGGILTFGPTCILQVRGCSFVFCLCKFRLVSCNAVLAGRRECRSDFQDYVATLTPISG